MVIVVNQYYVRFFCCSREVMVEGGCFSHGLHPERDPSLFALSDRGKGRTFCRGGAGIRL